MKSDLVDIEVLLKLTTDKAALVNDGKKDVWLPLSQIEIEQHEDSKTVIVTLPEWLAIDKGLA